MRLNVESRIHNELCPTLRANAGDNQVSVAYAEGFGETGIGYWQKGIQTLRAEGENRPSRPSNVICYGIDQQGGKGNASYTEGIAPTLASDSHDTPHGVAYGKDNILHSQD